MDLSNRRSKKSDLGRGMRIWSRAAAWISQGNEAVESSIHSRVLLGACTQMKDKLGSAKNYKQGREGKGKAWRLKKITLKRPLSPSFQRRAAIYFIITCVFPFIFLHLLNSLIRFTAIQPRANRFITSHKYLQINRRFSKLCKTTCTPFKRDIVNSFCSTKLSFITALAAPCLLKCLNSRPGCSWAFTHSPKVRRQRHSL